MRAIGISAISVILTAGVVGNAYYQKKQFYPSVVYITKSNASMAVIYVQSLVFVLMLGKLMRKIFLGTLRAAEFEHLMERFWYALTETCLAFTVFRDDFNPKFVALFTVLLFLKSFHWLAEERVDYMERSPVIGALFHVRVSALLSVLALLDYLMISHAYESTITKGATVQLVFGFEYAILITMVANIAIKYILHAAEMRTDNPWENKAVFLLYTELVIGFIRVVLYLLFVAIMVRIYTLPLFAFRPMYYTMRNFKKALNDVILSRRAIRNMNTLYPDATPEELSQSDNICIICREDMVNTSKKLPCGHIFHTACLRSWFQRQQTCPTCRLNILRNATVQNDRPAVNANLDQQNNNNNINNNNNNQPNADNPNAAAAAAAANNNGPNPQNINANNLHPNLFPNMPTVWQSPGSFSFNPFMMPTPPPAPNFMFPSPPAAPAGLDQLSDDELRLLEGNERRNVEERIKLLRNIQLLMDASVVLMNQYTAIAARFPPSAAQPSANSTQAQQPAEAKPASNSSSSTESQVPATPSADAKAGSVISSAVDATSASTSTSTSTSTDESQAQSSGSLSATNVIAIDESKVSIEDLGRDEDDQSTSDQAIELRRRRLQKFLYAEENKE